MLFPSHAAHRFDTCVDRWRIKQAIGDRRIRERRTYPVFQDKAYELQQDVLEVIKDVILEVAHVFMNIHSYLFEHVVAVVTKRQERVKKIFHSENMLLNPRPVLDKVFICSILNRVCIENRGYHHG